MGKATLTARPTNESSGDLNTLMMQLHGVSDWRREQNGSVTIEYDDLATGPETIVEALRGLGFAADVQRDDPTQGDAARGTANTTRGASGANEGIVPPEDALPH